MTSQPSASNLSIEYGPTDAPLWEKTLSSLVEEQAERYQSKTAVVVPWQNAVLTYRDIAERSLVVARAILAQGLRPGDFVGIFAGNRYEYLEAFLGSSHVGCPVVVLNNTYTPQELVRALSQTSCKLLFIATSIGTRSLTEHINSVLSSAEGNNAPDGLQVVSFGSPSPGIHGSRLQPYSVFTRLSPTSPELESIAHANSKVKPTDIINLQFTSGTTGTPKAAMLTHHNILNNAHLVGQRLALRPSSTICCPPPLFHCFGLVMGFLASLAHGAAILFPADAFCPAAAADALVLARCDVLLGVPTMLLGVLDALDRAGGENEIGVRAVLAAGAPVPARLVRRLRARMGAAARVAVAYGMTETSPVTFMADADGRRAGAVGRVMPHTGAKIVDGGGRVVARGARGELWTSGYALMRGYLGNGAATRESLVADEAGVVWMRTGDECVIDADGVCYVTGRIKDIIIRGGENIFPTEIEERLLAHPMVAEASVVGIRDEKYGEVVGCFLRAAGRGNRPEREELQNWVRESLGRHKAPKWVFWIGDAEVGEDYPKTGSGKHQKHVLRALGNRLAGVESSKAKL